MRVALQGGLAQPAEQHAAVGDHQREPIRRGLQALTDLADTILQTARHDVAASEVDGARLCRLRTFAGQAAGEPVGLAGDVVVDVLEAERVEPARGSWAHVSETVVAVDDDRLGLVEVCGGGRVELPERDVDRPGRVLVGVLVLDQHLDQLRPCIEQLAQPRVGDLLNHAPSRPALTSLLLAPWSVRRMLMSGNELHPVVTRSRRARSPRTPWAPPPTGSTPHR